MQINLKSALIMVGALLGLLATSAIVLTLKKNAYEARIVELQNAVATRDKTIEVQKGVYERLAIQSTDLKYLLVIEGEEVDRLKKALDKSGSKLLTANTIILQLREQLKVSGKPSVVITTPTPGGPAHFVIQRAEDFGPFRVGCTMEGEEPVEEGKVGDEIIFSQTRPIRLSVVVSQEKDGSWKSFATSSEEIFQVDIGLAAVNPYLLDPKWYEKIGLSADLGVGMGPGFLAGIGAFYEFGKFEVGPRAWVVIDRAGVSPYFGAQLLWHPFVK